MGVSNYDRYDATYHAIERYKQRIDSSRSRLSILKDLSTLMQDSRFLAKDQGYREVWLHEKRKIVLIIDPTTYKIITLYKTLEDYREEEPDGELAEETVSELVKSIYVSKDRELQAIRAPHYIEYGKRLADLSKTLRKDYYDENKQALAKLKRKIETLESQHEKFLSDLKKYIIEE